MARDGLSMPLSDLQAKVALLAEVMPRGRQRPVHPLRRALPHALP